MSKAGDLLKKMNSINEALAAKKKAANPINEDAPGDLSGMTVAELQAIVDAGPDSDEGKAAAIELAKRNEPPPAA